MRNLAVILILCAFSTLAHGQTNEAIVRAIYRAEGGAKARYPYGIRSIPCTGDQCRQYCLNTVRNNRKRFAKQTKYTDFIEFLGSRYCPTSGNLSPAEKKLNGNWVKNVKYFLKQEGVAR